MVEGNDTDTITVDVHKTSDGDDVERNPEEPGTDTGNKTKEKVTIAENTDIQKDTSSQEDDSQSETSSNFQLFALQNPMLESDFVSNMALFKQVSNLTSQLNDINKMWNGQPVDPEVVNKRQEQSFAFKQKYDPFLKEGEKVIKSGREAEARKLDKLVIPPDTGKHSKDFDINAVVKVCGKIGLATAKEQIRDFMDRLFEHGKNLAFSHDDYKQSFNACFTDELSSNFLSLKTKTFREIAEWFDTVYHKPRTYEDYERKLSDFYRHAGEGIGVFMKRYLLTAEKADALLPENQAHFTVEVQKIALLEKILLEPARTEFIRESKELEKAHSFTQYKTLINIAINIEDAYNCIPREEQPVSQYIHFLFNHRHSHDPQQSNVVTRNRHAGEPFESLPNTLPRKSVYRKNRDIDPYRSSSNVPNFYHGQNPPTGPASAPPARDQQSRRGRNQQRDQPVAKEKSSNNDRKSSNSNRGRGRGRGNRNSQRDRNNQNSQRDNNKQGSKKLYTGAFEAPGNQRSSSNRSRRSKRKFSGNQTSRSTSHKNHISFKFCMRCGVKKGKPKNATPSDHVTDDCPHYRYYCDDFCTYCSKYRNIDAHHQDEDCLRNPKNI